MVLDSHPVWPSPIICYMVDVPGGKGKVPILPDDVKREGRTWLSGSYLGEVVEYSDGD